MEDQSDSIVFYTGNTQNITVEAMKDMRSKAVVAAGIISVFSHKVPVFKAM
jgi:S-adenosylhomocysteine hydrolase